ncbi:MAG: hypothetical protein NC299_01570 [Lachnospiraceae bacterium]|nr:hypothetical protein [Ruminococcus sp.]MCM1274038.1 hypothetical protein [Lachnospiraceae bacterium]
MAVPSIGFNSGEYGFSVSSGKGVGSESNLRDTISRLEQERDKYRKENEQSKSELLDKKIGNLENRIDNLQKRLDKLKAEDDGECETCKNRKYQDESDDPGVSFKSASKISKGGAEAAVRGHEYEHVNRNQAKADREGKEIVYQSVIIKHGICPECGDSYVAGGETTTVTRDKPQERTDERFNVGLVDMQQNMGNLLNMLV